MKNIPLAKEGLFDYILSVSLREAPLLQKLRQETARHPLARMQITPEQGQLMALLLKLMQARKVLEIGVFTGYSSLCMALALPVEGKIIACDINEEFTSMAKRYWKEAEIEQKIELKIAPALSTLNELLKTGQAESFDFAFIDADKANYINYYEESLKLVRPGGLIVIDNVLWRGEVAHQRTNDKNAKHIQAFNQKLSVDERIDLSIIPIADGLTLALKKT